MRSLTGCVIIGMISSHSAHAQSKAHIEDVLWSFLIYDAHCEGALDSADYGVVVSPEVRPCKRMTEFIAQEAPDGINSYVELHKDVIYPSPVRMNLATNATRQVTRTYRELTLSFCAHAPTVGSRRPE